jgi:hypothetical protein
MNVSVLKGACKQVKQIDTYKYVSEQNIRILGAQDAHVCFDHVAMAVLKRNSVNSSRQFQSSNHIYW